MDQVARFQETPRELAIFDEELAEAGWWPSVAEASALAYMEGSWLHRDLALLFFSDDGPPQTFWRTSGRSCRRATPTSFVLLIYLVAAAAVLIVLDRRRAEARVDADAAEASAMTVPVGAAL